MPVIKSFWVSANQICSAKRLNRYLHRHLQVSKLCLPPCLSASVRPTKTIFLIFEDRKTSTHGRPSMVCRRHSEVTSVKSAEIVGRGRRVFGRVYRRRHRLRLSPRRICTTEVRKTLGIRSVFGVTTTSRVRHLRRSSCPTSDRRCRTEGFPPLPAAGPPIVSS